jgi:hypothetical protein
MRVACRRDDFDFTRRLGRRAGAGPRQLLRRVSPPRAFQREGGKAGGNKSDFYSCPNRPLASALARSRCDDRAEPKKRVF